MSRKRKRSSDRRGNPTSVPPSAVQWAIGLPAGVALAAVASYSAGESAKTSKGRVVLDAALVALGSAVMLKAGGLAKAAAVGCLSIATMDALYAVAPPPEAT